MHLDLVVVVGASTRPAGRTWTFSWSTVLTPIARAILCPSPCECSPFVVGKKAVGWS
jgi:hypothetical protein